MDKGSLHEPLLFRKKKHLFSTEYLPHVELGLENAATYF